MRILCGFLLAWITLSNADAQSAGNIEGFWQDIAGRTLFKRNVAPSATYGDWNPRELDATYPQAKLIRKVGTAYELTDLNYDEKEYSVKVLRATADGIDFVRAAAWSPCRTSHACRLTGDEMLCSLDTLCRVNGKELLDWRGEERYIRRASCERDGRPQLQGIPVKCR